jgi:hypothetical protein
MICASRTSVSFNGGCPTVGVLSGQDAGGRGVAIVSTFNSNLLCAANVVNTMGMTVLAHRQEWHRVHKVSDP